jgi:hypothetical protein
MDFFKTFFTYVFVSMGVTFVGWCLIFGVLFLGSLGIDSCFKALHTNETPIAQDGGELK